MYSPSVLMEPKSLDDARLGVKVALPIPEDIE